MPGALGVIAWFWLRGFRGWLATAEAGIRLTTQGKGAWIPTSVGVIMEHL